MDYEELAEIIAANPHVRIIGGATANTATTGKRAPVTGVVSPPGADTIGENRPGPAPLPKPRRREEDKLIADIIGAGHLFGWLCYHQRPARTRQGYRTALQGDAGFPDLVLVHGPKKRIIFAECKRDGKPEFSEGQLIWQAALWPAAKFNHDVEYFVWQPADWPDICKVLQEGK